MLKLTTAGWNPDTTIQEIQALAQDLQKSGKKLCLFIGRVPGEPFPGFGQEKPENEVWISLDQNTKTHKFQEGQQIHLILDIYDERIQKIKHLFAKVILDVGTLRHLTHHDNENPWLRLKELLIPNCDSQLITEASNQAQIHISEMIPYLQQNLSTNQACTAIINKNIQTHYNMLKESKQFKSVELFQDTPFPYAYRPVSQPTSHFIFTGF